MSNKSGIYKITSPSGKIYIGETVNFEKRFKRYESLQCKNQFKLYNSFMKYGVNNHIFEIIEECDFNDLKCRERYYQDKYDVLSDNGMNLKLTSCADLKQIYSRESIEKANKTKIERKVGIGENNGMFRKVHTDETKSKISKANKNRLEGDKNPMFGKKGSQHPAYGTKRTKDVLERASINNSHGNNPMAKFVLDLESGVYYNSASEVAELLNINKYTFRSKLNGNLKNNTNFIYC
jgi:group I intron endonuclease